MGSSSVFNHYKSKAELDNIKPYNKFIIKITISKNEWKNKKSCCVLLKELLMLE